MKDPKNNEELLKEKAVKNAAHAEQILSEEEEIIAEAAQPVAASEVVVEAAIATATTPSVPAAPGQSSGQQRGGGGDRQRRGGGGGRDRRPGSKKPSLTADSGLIEKVVSINRVAKTTKGGTRLAFSALVVVGDGKGKVGYGLGKAGEVATAIKKGLNAARKEMVMIPRRGTTITHEIIGSCGSAQVLLKPASEGTGVIASGAVRAVCDGAGISNILTKCHRSNNPINVVKATFDGLSRLKLARVKVAEAVVAAA